MVSTDRSSRRDTQALELSRWMSMNLAAFSRSAALLDGVMACRTSTLAVSRAELHVHLVLEGSPWQSHPAHTVSVPSMLRDMTTKSFEHLVEQGAHVNVAIGVGRAVVEIHSGREADALRRRP